MKIKVDNTTDEMRIEVKCTFAEHAVLNEAEIALESVLWKLRLFDLPSEFLDVWDVIAHVHNDDMANSHSIKKTMFNKIAEKMIAELRVIGRIIRSAKYSAGDVLITIYKDRSYDTRSWL